MKTIKSLLISLILIFSLYSLSTAEYFTDIIISGTKGNWTDSRSFTTLNDAVIAIGSNERILVISSPQSVTTLTIPSNITLQFEKDGSITNSGQLTINTTNIIAPNRQIFTGAGDIDFASGTELKTSWFADFETASNLTSDDTVTLIVSKAQTLTSSQALGDNVILKWESPGNILTANAGVTISNINQVESGNYQLFAGTGNFRFRDGTTINLYWFNNLRAAITYASTNKLTLLVQGTHAVDYSDTVPSTLAIKHSQGGLFTIATGVTLTINGPFEAGLYRVFDCVGTGKAVLSNYTEYINIIWYGAGNGGNITNLLQQIVSFHDKIYIPSGEYIVENLKIYANTQIKGDGPTKTVLKPETTSGNTKIIYTDPTVFNSYIKLENFSIDANRTAGGLLSTGLLELKNCHYFILENILVKNPVCHAFMIDDSSRGTIRNCQAIVSNVYTFDFDDGFAIGGDSHDILIQGCYARGFNHSGNQSGFEVDDGPYNITFVSNKAESCTLGFTVHTHADQPNVKNISYYSCVAYNCTNGFVSHARLNTYIQTLNYTNCVADTCASAGFRFLNSEGGPVFGVSLNNCASLVCGKGIENQTSDIKVNGHFNSNNLLDYDNSNSALQCWTNNFPENPALTWTPTIIDQSGNIGAVTVSFANYKRHPNGNIRATAQLTNINTSALIGSDVIQISNFPGYDEVYRHLVGACYVNSISYDNDVPIFYLSYTYSPSISTGTWTNSSSAYSSSLTGTSATGFGAVSDGSSTTKVAQTPDNISLVAGKKYKVSYDRIVNSGITPAFYIRQSYGSGFYHVNFTTNTSFTFIARLTDTVTACFRTEPGDSTDYVISNFKIEEYIGLAKLKSNKSDGTVSDVKVNQVSSGVGDIDFNIEYQQK